MADIIKRFDLVSIKSIKKVQWLSGPASRPATPQGVWAVFCGVGRDELILAKNETLIRIPASDVFKVADYGLEHAIETLRHIRTKMDIDKYPLTPLKGNKNVKKTRN